MKRIFTGIAMAVAAAVAFTNCTKQNITNTTDSAYSTTYTLTQSSWQVNPSGGWQVSLTDNSLTQAITSSGAVWIYISTDGGSNYELLPSNNNGDNNNYDFVGIAGTGGFTVYAFPVSSTVTTAPASQIVVKEVNIPGASQNQTSSVNFSDYNAVKKAYNLKN